MGPVERKDFLRTAFARARRDHSVMARRAGDLALAETRNQLPTFLPIEANDSRMSPQGVFKDYTRILGAEPMRAGQTSQDRVGFNQRLEREDDVTGFGQERTQLGGGWFVLLMPRHEGSEDDAGVEGCGCLKLLILHARGPLGGLARPSL